MSPAGAVAALALSAAQPSDHPSPPPTAPAVQAPPAPGSVPAPIPAPPDQAQTTDDSNPAEPLADDTKGTTVDQAYQAAEGRQGPLDGSWRLSDGAGAPLFDFQLTDPGGAPSPRASEPNHPDIEGAWRDLRREGGLGASGVLQSVRHDGPSLVISFTEAVPARPTRLALHPAANGGWTGELDEAGRPPLVVFLERQ